MSTILGGVRILIVDDHESMRLIISTLLRAFGFTTLREATDGDEALDIASTFEPDLVITDMRMPRLDGIELLRGLRGHSNDRFHQVPVIMVTGHASESVIRTALAAGANEFLVKPITGRGLADRIKRLAA